MQIIHKTMPLSFQVIELDSDEGDTEAQAMEHAQKSVAKLFDLSRGPLMRCVSFSVVIE